MNVEIEKEAMQFLFRENIKGIIVAVSAPRSILLAPRSALSAQAPHFQL
jgi:hypothetical protein